jgi:hypothetical protein
LVLALHEDIARSVPDFVTKVTVTLDAWQIKPDITACGSKRCEGKAQSIGTESGDAVLECQMFSIWKHFLGSWLEDRNIGVIFSGNETKER